MGVLQRFERRLEGAVGTAFARLFKGQVEPVEVAKALQREAEARRAIVGQDRVLVPPGGLPTRPTPLPPGDEDKIFQDSPLLGCCSQVEPPKSRSGPP